MANLCTRLGPLRLANPVIAASCEFTMTEEGIRSCIDAGAGAVVAKSVNEDPAAARQLDIAQYALLDDTFTTRPWAAASRGASLFNQSGLAQSGLEDWLAMLDRCERYARSRGSLVIGSVTVAAPEPAARIAHAMSEVVSCVEINLSAPHGREVSNGAVRQISHPRAVAEYTATVRASVDCPLIVKLTGQTDDVAMLAREAVNAGADIVAMIGRFQGFLPDLDTQRPVLGSWGAIGGSWALPLSLYWVSKSYLALPSGTPIIGTNGARDGDDALRFLLSGAGAVEFASAVLMRGPTVLGEAVSRIESYLEEHGVADVADLVGRATRAARTYGELGRRAGGATTGAADGVRPWERFLPTDSLR